MQRDKTVFSCYDNANQFSFFLCDFLRCTRNHLSGKSRVLYKAGPTGETRGGIEFYCEIASSNDLKEIMAEPGIVFVIVLGPLVCVPGFLMCVVLTWAAALYNTYKVCLAS
jgi:hypothetical protein